MTTNPSKPELAAELEDLRAQLSEAKEALHAIRNGEVDAVVVTGGHGQQVYTLSGADSIYRQLIETMSEGAVTLSLDGVILYGNVRLAEMLGRPLDQVLGSVLRNYLPPADQQALDAILAQARTEPGHREINLKTSDGSLVPAYLSASRLHSEGAEMVFCLVLTNLTEQKRHEQVGADERLARLILEQAAEAIIVCDEQGRVIRASQAAQRFCDGSALLQPFAEAFPLRTDASNPFHLAPVLQGETLRNVDVALDRPGQKFELILNAGPIFNGQQILGCVVTLTNITERKRAQERLALIALRTQVLLELHQLAAAPREQVMDFALEASQRITQSGFSFFGLMDEKETVLTIYRWSKEAMAQCALGDQPRVFPVAEAGLWGDCIRQRKPVLVNDYSAPHPNKKGIPEGHVPIRRFLGVPLFDGSRLVAVAAVANKPEVYTETDITALTSLMNKLWEILRRKQADQALADLSSRQEAILAAVPDIITEVDNHKVYTWANQAGFAFFGDDMIGREAAFYFEGEQDTYAAVRPLFDGHKDTIYVESWQRRKDGAKRLLAWWCRVLKDENGNLTGALSSAWDITESKQTEMALRLAHERFRRFIDANIIGIVIADAAGAIIEANDYYLRLTGYTREDLDHGQLDWRAITPPEWLPADEQAIRELRERGTCTPYEKEYVRRDGTRVPVLLADAMLPGPGEQIAAFAIDISQRKQAESEVLRLNTELEQRVADRTAQLEAANQELEAFSRSVSHDLRAPLRGIDGWAQALLDDFGDKLGEAGLQLLHRQRAASQRMGTLIEDLLRLSRLTRQPLKRQTVALPAMVQQVWEELRPAQPPQTAELVVGTLTDCQADASLLTQVFVNLLGNALKFSSGQAHPRIEVGSQAGPDHECVFFVKDNGAGFDMRYASKLFGAFQRLHSAREFPGTGIGLAIVQRIIRRHGGRIWAESAVGQGATFFFTLREAKDEG